MTPKWSTHEFKPLYPQRKKITTITKILTTEHLREPTSLLWSALAPCILFIITQPTHAASTYTASAAWFYSYISATLAFFGFSFYLIGRRESGFTRSSSTNTAQSSYS